jgi:tetratricopeptide (TPR) repeat protein
MKMAVRKGFIGLLAGCLLALGLARGAAAAEGTMPEHTPSSPGAVLEQGNAAPLVHDAYVQIIRGNFEEALKLSNEAIAKYPADPDAYVARSLALASLGDNEGALADAEHAIELDPASGAAYFAKGTALLRMGRADEARDNFARACDLGETRGCKFLK